jgi:hypothetical protein
MAAFPTKSRFTLYITLFLPLLNPKTRANENYKQINVIGAIRLFV